MKRTITTLSVAILAVFGAQSVLAQDKTRAEVKKETAEANKKGEIPGTGTGPSATAAQPKVDTKSSDTTRAERKEKTAEANKAGDIPGTGTGPNANAAAPKITTKSDTTRAERKEKTAAANKAGEIKSGEANIEEKKK